MGADFGNTIYDGNMGGLFSFAKKVIKAPIKATIKTAKVAVKTAPKVVGTTAKISAGAVVKGVTTTVKTGTALSKGDVKGAFTTAVKGTASVAMTPAKLTFAAAKISTDVVKELPITGAVYKVVDKYSGGLLTKGEMATDVGNRLVNFKKVTPAELLSSGLFVAMVAATVFTAGAATSAYAAYGTYAAAAASQMKQGPLGKVKIVGSVLGATAIAAAVYNPSMTMGGVGQAVATKYAEDKIKKMGTEVAANALGVKPSIVSAMANFGTEVNVASSMSSASGMATKIADGVAVAARKEAEKLPEKLQAAAIKKAKEEAADMLGVNAKLLNVDIRKIAGTDISAEARKQLAAQITKVEGAKIDALNFKISNLKTNSLTLRSLTSDIEKKLASAKAAKDSKAEEAAQEELELARFKTLEVEKEAVSLNLDKVVAENQVAVKIAAAEEGRYHPSDQFLHPLIFA